MEFFDWLNIPQLFIMLFMPQTAETAEEAVAALRQNLIICLAVAGGLFLLGLILGGIGLYAMAKKEGIKPSFLAFVPFANTWYAGKIAGETNFFGQKMKRAGLYAMLSEIVYAALETVLVVFEFILTKPEYYDLIVEDGTQYWDRSSAFVPANMQWQLDMLTYGSIVAYILNFFLLVMMIALFIALFRKYYAKSPVLMTILCTILPFRGFTLFAVRKNTPVDYNAYIRRRAEAYARRNNPYYGGYDQGNYNQGYNQGGYSQGNNNQGNNGGGPAPADPFDEFGNSNGTPGGSGQGDNPFDDFN